MAWQCSGCEESVDDPLDACWRCGTSRTGEPDPDFPADDREAPDTPPPQVAGASTARVIVSGVIAGWVSWFIYVFVRFLVSGRGETLGLVHPEELVGLFFSVFVGLCLSVALLASGRAIVFAERLRSAERPGWLDDATTPVLCPRCLLENPPTTRACQHCAMPLTAHASVVRGAYPVPVSAPSVLDLLLFVSLVAALVVQPRRRRKRLPPPEEDISGPQWEDEPSRLSGS